MAVVILSKEGRPGRQKSQTTLPDPEVQGKRSSGSQVVGASGHRAGTEPTPLPPQTAQENVGRNQGSRG